VDQQMVLFIFILLPGQAMVNFKISLPISPKCS